MHVTNKVIYVRMHVWIPLVMSDDTRIFENFPYAL